MARHNRDTESFHHLAPRYPAALDEKKLGKDVLSAITRLFADGEEFSGHDGRQYTIIGINAEETESESFVDVVVKLDQGRRVVAKYAIILQQISR